MKVRLEILLLFFVFQCSASFSQIAAVRDGQGSITNLHQMKITPAVHELHLEGVHPSAKILNYEEIKGSPFFTDEWMPAFLFSGTQLLVSVSARYNLVSKEIHFLKNEKEFVVASEQIGKIVFTRGKTDSLVFRQIDDLLAKKQKLHGFVQVLCHGRHQLLKFTGRTVGEKDSLFGTQKTYFFKDEVRYFITWDNKAGVLKKLDKENCLAYIPSSATHSQWIKENKINFKKEEDVIRFLNHYNTSKSNQN